MASRSGILWSILLVLFLASAARAESVTVAWDSNQEPDLAGYLVSYGRSSGVSETVVDAGMAASWTLPNAVAGTTYFFRIFAYNHSGQQSIASEEISTAVWMEPVAPRFATNRRRLDFGAVRSGGTTTGATAGQSLLVTQNGPTAVSWNVSTTAPWLRISPANGSGTGAVTVQLGASLPSVGIYDATIIVTGPDTIETIPVRLRVYAAGTSSLPFGSFDTPADGTANVTGAIPVTGWAMDDVQVAKVQIFRDAVVQGADLVYIGDATFVAGARPDVENAYPQWPAADRSGWGFMLLTNMLPDIALGQASGGNGTFRLHAYAIDVEGQIVNIGSKSIAVDNRSATRPFGTIDTPSQGGTASGSAFVNFGWAVSPGGTIAADGSTMIVLIDGVAVGRPTYNNFRADIASAFPGYANSTGAVGYYILDTTTLANGLHTISWVASDDAGNTSGLGSRFFNVLNGSSASVQRAGVRARQTAAATRNTASSGLSARAIAGLPVESAAVEVARIAETGNTPELVMPEWSGEVRVRTREAEPIDLQLASRFGEAAGGAYEGYSIVAGETRPLPPGSTLDATRGTFSWQPGAGFLGTYHLVFVRTTAGGAKTQIPVRVSIIPKFDRERPRTDRSR